MSILAVTSIVSNYRSHIATVVQEINPARAFAEERVLDGRTLRRNVLSSQKWPFHISGTMGRIEMSLFPSFSVPFVMLYFEGLIDLCPIVFI